MTGTHTCGALKKLVRQKKNWVARLLSARHNLQSPTAAPFHADAAMGIEVTDTHPGHEDHKHSQPTRVGPPPPIEPLLSLLTALIGD